MHTVFQKRPSFYFLITLLKLTDFNNYGMLNFEKISHEHLTLLSTSPATLPWEIFKKSFFQQYYSHILLIFGTQCTCLHRCVVGQMNDDDDLNPKAVSASNTKYQQNKSEIK